MKRWSLLLMALLLLTGCTHQPEPTTAPAVQTEPAEKLAGISQQGNATAVFSLGDQTYEHIMPMGRRLLLLSSEGDMMVLQGDDCQIMDRGSLPGEAEPDHPAFRSDPTGLSYYDRENGQVIFLNPRLQQTQAVPMPEGADGEPAVSFSHQEIYYCKDTELRALDVQTGISRMIKSQVCKKQEIVQAGFDGEIVCCRVTDFDNQEKYIYVETQTGKTIASDVYLSDINTFGDTYFASYQEGMDSQWIFGIRSGTPKVFTGAGKLYPVLTSGGVVTADKDTWAELSYYSLKSEKRTGAVTVSGMGNVLSAAASGSYVWILGRGEDGQVLCRWNPAATPVNDEKNYTSPLYTWQEPDTEGMEACKASAGALEKAHNIRILFGEEIHSAIEEHKVVTEYQVSAITHMLSGLEEDLRAFPYGFLEKTIRGGKLHVGLVRQIDSGTSGIQFFQNGNAWVLLTPDSSKRHDFFMCMGQVVDSFVLGNSRKYDEWNDLNPSGFTYGEENLKYLNEQNRAFADAASMASPYAERSRMFAYALLPEGERLFSGPVMQAKLETVCRAIREAYGLEKSPDRYQWEQYLNTDLTFSEN